MAGLATAPTSRGAARLSRRLGQYSLRGWDYNQPRVFAHLADVAFRRYGHGEWWNVGSQVAQQAGGFMEVRRVTTDKICGWATPRIPTPRAEAQLHLAGDDVVVFSKTGADFTKRFRSIADAIQKLPASSCILAH